MKYGKTFTEALREVSKLQEDGHTDVASAVRQCKTAIEDASEMLSKLQGMNPEGDLPSWWMNKIAIAANSMNKLRDYLLVPSTTTEDFADINRKRAMNKDRNSDRQKGSQHIPPIDKDNAPGVKIAKIRATGNDANKVADLKTKLSKEKDTDALERQIVTLTSQVGLLKAQLENEKNKITKPEPNPLTGEVPLRTGVASALLDKKGPKPNVEKQNKDDVKLSKKKSKIEINPDVEMGVFSGGKKTNQGSELY